MVINANWVGVQIKMDLVVPHAGQVLGGPHQSQETRSSWRGVDEATEKQFDATTNPKGGNCGGKKIWPQLACWFHVIAQNQMFNGLDVPLDPLVPKYTNGPLEAPGSPPENRGHEVAAQHGISGDGIFNQEDDEDWKVGEEE
jgi:hypothetical protein